MAGWRQAIELALQACKRLRERRNATLRLGIDFIARHEHADPPHAVALLRPRHHRARRRAPEPCNELPPPHLRIANELG